MLSAEGLRLAAIEVLCPTSALLADAGFPTLAGSRIFDSKAAPVSEIDARLDYQPVASLYTRETVSQPRGDASDADDFSVRSILEIVAELATVVADGDQEPFVDAVAEGDAQARLTLAAFTAQIRWLLLHSEAGGLFRRFNIEIERIEEETHAIPNLGLRWQRVFLRIHASIPQDRFSDDGGLPEPLKKPGCGVAGRFLREGEADRVGGSLCWSATDSARSGRCL